ncbi:hypothetical protein HYPSUDRAFT_177918 [Hypholoma sublateritium FD-334 SS-4]|uniref:FAM86 N-terminal domain-containing protein n=1 Tax=Hypholoma sublateritium (strain FD-334 SS-4) TaxID=945553 RepID=A0A0D2PJU3_HYPSF|nr:hypothetical protein HYPSUDRAFT_177918 [Hypholoma sublateritium FD-334 SS-4]
MHHQLFTLLRNYYALTPVNRLQLPLILPPNRINDFLVCEILINEHHQRYPPSPEYQKRFWKWAIAHLEELARVKTSGEDDEEFEIDSRIYDYYLSLMLPAGSSSGFPSRSARSQIYGKSDPRSESPPSQSYVTHFWNMIEPPRTSSSSSLPLDRNEYHTASLLESRTVVEGGTTGLRTWLASFFLAQYLILHPDLVSSKCIMELGSGIGFLGIIVASLQQLHESTLKEKGSCWLTDINDEVLNRCRNNVNLPCNISSIHSNIHYRILDWHESSEDDNSSMATIINDDINPDLILGADVAYDPSLIPPLVGTLKVALHHSLRPAIIAITLRNEETWNYFFSSVASASLHVEEITTGFDRPSFWETVENQDMYWVVKLFRITSTAQIKPE